MSTRPVAALAVVLLAACGAESTSPTATAEPSAPVAAQADATFPVTIATAFGDVTMESEPQRVVALGWGDAETALALGLQPVGAADLLAFGGEGVGPWAEGLYDTPPELLGTLDLNLEALAALEPDLILDTRSDGTQERHDSLARIAPVVGAPADVVAYGTTWQQQLDVVGRALGRTEEADVIAERVEQAFADAAAEHPEFDGATVAVGANTAEGWGAYVQGDARVEFMEQMGFVNNDAVDALATGSFFVPVSPERLDLLDGDLTVVFPIFVEAAEFADYPLFTAIASVADGRSVIIDDLTLANAFSSGTALGITFALEGGVPLFAAALAEAR